MYFCRGSNPGPTAHKTVALPSELQKWNKKQFYVLFRTYASAGARTLDLRLIRPSLYHLSYRSVCMEWGSNPRGHNRPWHLKCHPLTTRASMLVCYFYVFCFFLFCLFLLYFHTHKFHPFLFVFPICRCLWNYLLFIITYITTQRLLTSQRWLLQTTA